MIRRRSAHDRPVRLGIAGLGTVGTGVVKIVQRQANLLARRCGRPVEITAVSARSRDKDRGVSLEPTPGKTTPWRWPRATMSTSSSS
jgi:homoserine dehydrogenase